MWLKPGVAMIQYRIINRKKSDYDPYVEENIEYLHNQLQYVHNKLE